MLQIGIESEADMDFAIQHTVKVAKSDKLVTKSLTVSFNSEGMMDIFMNNLFTVFEKENIPDDSGLHLHLILPEDC
tara:strand:- start:1524 stop:1751 length:228 start_codon:yes stop_codon:yes gene_type:complete